jgi:excisionase family DNA binding protein
VTEGLITTAELSKVLRVSPRTLARWAQDGTLQPAYTLPNGHHRWRLSDVEAQLRAQRQRDE